MLSHELSQDTITELRRLGSIQNDYVPCDEVRDELQQKSIVMLVGPSAIGKSTVMETVTRMDGDFAIAGTFTSRDARTDDTGKNYTYIPHTDEGLKLVFDRIRSREVVQYAIHPVNLTVYGTEISDYPSDVSMLDVMSGAVDGFHKLSFRTSLVVGLVAQPDMWQQWFDQRMPVGHTQRESCRKEAIMSLSWLLNQPRSDVMWVENKADDRRTVALNVIQIARGESTGDSAKRRLGADCLALAISMR